MDATSWPVPDDVNFVYMFNPFEGEIFKAVAAAADRVAGSPAATLTLIYANPECSAELLATGRFERVRRSRWPRPDKPKQRVEVYRATVGRVSSKAQLITERAGWRRLPAMGSLAVEASNAITTAAWTLAWLAPRRRARDRGAGGRRARRGAAGRGRTVLPRGGARRVAVHRLMGGDFGVPLGPLALPGP